MVLPVNTFPGITKNLLEAILGFFSLFVFLEGGRAEQRYSTRFTELCLLTNMLISGAQLKVKMGGKSPVKQAIRVWYVPSTECLLPSTAGRTHLFSSPMK